MELCPCYGPCDCIKNKAAEPQPPPIKTEGASMHDLVVRDIMCWRPSRTDRLVVTDLEARKVFGFEKYGTMLQAHNGRDALMDAYQEVLDLLVYLKQDCEEHPGAEASGDYSDALKLARILRRRLEVRA